MEHNLQLLLAGLRQAAGSGVPIVGITYPDVFLGLDRSKDPAQKDLAIVSVPTFEHVLNPALKAQYLAIGGAFVDVTQATGAYIPLTTTRSGTHPAIPTAVADVCTLTYYCQLQDVHPRTGATPSLRGSSPPPCPGAAEAHGPGPRPPRGGRKGSKRSPRRETNGRPERPTLPTRRRGPHRTRRW